MPEVTATEVQASWGETLRLERHRQRLTQAEVALRAGLSQKVVSTVESGRGALQSFLDVATALGIDLLGESS